MKKKINHRLWSIFSLIALLFPLITSIGQASTVVADVVDPGLASVTLHKRVGVTGLDKQNTGSVMNFGGTALNGVTFQAFDITQEFYRLRDLNKTITVEDIYDSLKKDAEFGVDEGKPTISFGSGSTPGNYIDEKTTTGEGTAVFQPLNKISYDKDAVYYFHESASPETVTGKGDIVLGFPVYEFDRTNNVYTDNELSDIHLYPKNDQASGGMQLIKNTDTLAGTEKLVAGATFVIHRIRDNVEQWVTGLDTDGNIDWGDEGDAYKFVTDTNGQFTTSPYIDADGKEVNFPFAGGEYLVTEIGAPDKMMIPNSAINKSFTIDTSATKPVVVNIKNDTPDIEKELDVAENVGNDFDIGEEIPFNINFMVPGGIADKNNATPAEYRYTEFNIVDTPSTGLEYITSQTATLWAGTTKVENVDFRIDPADNGGFTLYFNKDQSEPGVSTPNNEQLGKYAGQILTLKFNMVLNDDAKPDEEETNTPTLNWTNDSTVYDKDGDPVPVITYGHKFSKINATTGATLTGAQFVVQRSEGTATVYYTGNTENLWVSAPDENEGETWENIGVKIYTSDEDGLVDVTGLALGAYKLKEIKTISDKYVLPQGAFDFTVVAGGYGETSAIQPVENFEKGRLPITGGMGRMIFMIIGLGAMLAVGAYYLKRRQQQQA